MRERAYNQRVQKALVATLLSLSACTSHDYQPYLRQELGFIQLGVQLESEEKEVRRVLAQRALRVVARLDDPIFIALGAATRDGSKSAVRLVSRRGVVLAEDASFDDLFAPGTVSLLEHFGGTLGEYQLLAHARIARGRDVGCVTLHRVLPDGSIMQCPLDVSALGARACVSNLAPGRGGHMQATVAWPGLYALATPQLEVELAFNEAAPGQQLQIPVAHVVPGPWLDSEGRRLSTLRLSRASFSQRHAAGVARAAVALLTGHDRATQANAYRNAVSDVLPGTTEAQIVADATAHIQRGWLDLAEEPTSAPDAPREPPVVEPGDQVVEGVAPLHEEPDTVIEPTPRSGLPP
ncbi:MAG: hypothetical protein JWN04_2511 [Myxococcaceae bacterium]|nr:hypothetical protein [Myxococcaceae bacterium]